MNKIERAIIERARKLIFEYAAEELERVKTAIQNKTSKTHIDLFNSGILLDVDKLKTHGINYAQKTIRKQEKINK